VALEGIFMAGEILWKWLIVALAIVIFAAAVQVAGAKEGVPVRMAVYTTNDGGAAPVATAIHRAGENDASVESVRYGRRWYGGYRGGWYGGYRPYRAYYPAYNYAPYTTYYPGYYPGYYYPGTYYYRPGYSFYYGW
jgi:hypothetical protein